MGKKDKGALISKEKALEFNEIDAATEDMHDPDIPFDIKLDVLKKQCRVNKVSDKYIEIIKGSTAKDSVMSQLISNNDLRSSNPMKKIRWGDYVKGVVYASAKLSGESNISAWLKTLTPSQRLVESQKAIGVQASKARSFSMQEYVVKILERIYVPVWLSNTDKYQKAIDCQVELMGGAKSEMVRMQAANSLLTHLKPPEVIKAEIEHKSDIGLSVLDQLQQRMSSLAQKERDSIKAKVITVNELVESKITEGEFDEK